MVLNSSNWKDGVEVTVSTRQDADGVNDVVTLSHVATSMSGGAAGDYDGAGGPMEGESIKDVTVTVTDDDPPMVVFEETPVTVTEGGTKVLQGQAGDGTDGHGDGYDQ